MKNIKLCMLFAITATNLFSSFDGHPRQVKQECYKYKLVTGKYLIRFSHHSLLQFAIFRSIAKKLTEKSLICKCCPLLDNDINLGKIIVYKQKTYLCCGDNNPNRSTKQNHIKLIPALLAFDAEEAIKAITPKTGDDSSDAEISLSFDSKNDLSSDNEIDDK